MGGSIWIKAAGGAFLVGSAAIAGCGQVIRVSAARPVSLAEFAQAKTPGGEEPEHSAPAPVVEAPLAAGDPFDDPLFFEESLRQPIFRLTEPGERVIVDSLVGEVNGRPIFADAFLEPIEDRLIQAAEQHTGTQREAAFRMIIHGWLQDVIIDELILAEAEAALTPNEQMGLFAFIRTLQEETIRRSGGTRAQTERHLRTRGEAPLDEYLQDQKKLIIVDQLRRRKIEPRVIVSWRDIEREYESRYAEFNPEATVTLARIRLHTVTQADEIEEVRARLAGGEAFAEIAEDLGFPNGGEWVTFTMGPGGISDIEVSDQMKLLLEGLGPAETSEVFTQGRTTMWLHVASVDRPEVRDIYDKQVQRLLAAEIRRRRSEEEWNRYIASLLQRGIYDELDKMAQRLYEIAMLRYGR